LACLDVLHRFAEGHIPVAEFASGYWSSRFRWQLVDDPLRGELGHTIQAFEHDLSRYEPDPDPQIQESEDRELRRRAATVLHDLEAVLGADWSSWPDM
jgi:hypothetical protein